MSTSIIDGTVEEAVPGRRRGGLTVFKSIRFRLDDGSDHTMAKAVVKQAVADELTPGARGRFYRFDALDIRGIHGVRAADGRAIYAFPANNQTAALVLAVVLTAWIAFKLSVDGELPLLAAALLILSAVVWIFMAKGQAEAKRQFERDAGYPGAGAAPVTQLL